MISLSRYASAKALVTQAGIGRNLASRGWNLPHGSQHFLLTIGRDERSQNAVDGFETCWRAKEWKVDIMATGDIRLIFA